MVKTSGTRGLDLCTPLSLEVFITRNRLPKAQDQDRWFSMLLIQEHVLEQNVHLFHNTFLFTWPGIAGSNFFTLHCSIELLLPLNDCKS